MDCCKRRSDIIFFYLFIPSLLFLSQAFVEVKDDLDSAINCLIIVIVKNISFLSQCDLFKCQIAFSASKDVFSLQQKETLSRVHTSAKNSIRPNLIWNKTFKIYWIQIFFWIHIRSHSRKNTSHIKYTRFIFPSRSMQEMHLKEKKSEKICLFIWIHTKS